MAWRPCKKPAGSTHVHVLVSEVCVVRRTCLGTALTTQMFIFKGLQPAEQAAGAAAACSVAAKQHCSRKLSSQDLPSLVPSVQEGKDLQMPSLSMKGWLYCQAAILHIQQSISGARGPARCVARPPRHPTSAQDAMSSVTLSPEGAACSSTAFRMQAASSSRRRPIQSAD